VSAPGVECRSRKEVRKAEEEAEERELTRIHRKVAEGKRGKSRGKGKRKKARTTRTTGKKSGGGDDKALLELKCGAR